MFVTAFEVVAPEMFAAEAAAPEIATLGSEFGTEAMFSGASEFGTPGLLGEYATNQGILGALGAGGAGAPGAVTQANMAADVLGGGAGAGGAGINEAQIASQQAKATELANSGIQQAQQGAERFADTASQNLPAQPPAPVQSVMNNPPVTDMPYQPGWTPEKELLPQVPGGRLPPGMTGASAPLSEPSGFMKGVSDVMDWADKNPFKAGIGAYIGAQKLGLFNQKKEQIGEAPYKGGILQNYKMSPDFKGRFANPQDYQYTPKVYNMAEGGIASYRAGGDTLSDRLSYFESLRQGQTSSPPSGKTAPHGDHGDVGIYYDLDPDTRSLDAVTAAQIRQAKVNKRANMQLPSMQRPTPMGQLNLAPPGAKAQDSGVMTEAAHGGVMSLGGYAAGGNPRLLKGPGDGMSDNIPATIADKQPARLADGEFVVPADVVSHLGNGSTEAGAKKLHDMMTNVRKARTGNPKQGKQINPNKFMPK